MNYNNKTKIEKYFFNNKNEIIIDIYEQMNQDLDNYLAFLDKETNQNNEKANIDLNYSYN